MFGVVADGGASGGGVVVGGRVVIRPLIYTQVKHDV